MARTVMQSARVTCCSIDNVKCLHAPWELMMLPTEKRCKPLKEHRGFRITECTAVVSSAVLSSMYVELAGVCVCVCVCVIVLKVV